MKNTIILCKSVFIVSNTEQNYFSLTQRPESDDAKSTNKKGRIEIPPDLTIKPLNMKNTIILCNPVLISQTQNKITSLLAGALRQMTQNTSSQPFIYLFDFLSQT